MRPWEERHAVIKIRRAVLVISFLEEHFGTGRVQEFPHELCCQSP